MNGFSKEIMYMVSLQTFHSVLPPCKPLTLPYKKFRNTNQRILFAENGAGLDVLLKDASGQTVEGAITFAGGVSLQATSEVVSGVVDGVDIKAALADAVLKTGAQEIVGKACDE